MSFMKGRYPLVRTIRHLKKGIPLDKRVHIVTVNYNTNHKPSRGAREFVKLTFPQLQYKNKDVQFVSLKNMTPSPFIQVYLDNGEKVLIDCDGQPYQAIVDHFKMMFQSNSITEAAEKVFNDPIPKVTDNPANFGKGCKNWCICEVPGQFPCPGYEEMPREFKGKYLKQKEEDDGY